MHSVARRPASPWPSLGFGAGLRAQHYPEIFSEAPRLDWFEAITENHFDSGGRALHVLERLRRDRPIALHGVALSIGSADPLDESYLANVHDLVERIEPALITDHLCWSGVDGTLLHDLLPLPYTEEALAHVADKVRRVQDFLRRRILLENPSTYVAFAHSTMPEWTFMAELAAAADCGILLDVNNVYVSARNLDFDPYAYIDAIPPDHVGQIHLAGYTDMGTYLFDTHSAPVSEDVWRLYAHACRRIGEVSTLVEWDADIPPLQRLVAEVDRAREVGAAACGADGEQIDDGAARTAAAVGG